MSNEPQQIFDGVWVPIGGADAHRAWASLEKLSVIADMERLGNQHFLSTLRAAGRRWLSKGVAEPGTDPLPSAADATQSEYVSVEAASIQLRMAERTIRHWCNTGKLAGAMKDKETARWRIPRAALQEHR